MSLRDDSTSAASSSHLDPGQLKGALVNSLVGFSPCLPFYFTHPASIPVSLFSLFSLSSYTLLSVCPVANYLFNTQTHKHTRQRAKSHLHTKVMPPITFTVVMSRFTVEAHALTHISFSYIQCCVRIFFIYLRHT